MFVNVQIPIVDGWTTEIVVEQNTGRILEGHLIVAFRLSYLHIERLQAVRVDSPFTKEQDFIIAYDRERVICHLNITSVGLY